MKKVILVILALVILFLVYNNEKVDATVVIPEGAIRVRVIANSNTIEDQSMKMKVKKYIEDNLSVLLVDVKDVDEARGVINDNIDSLKTNIDNIFMENDYNMTYDVNFGNNYFPLKEYKGVVYKEGAYESLVVTIGSGSGDNWWCVLFPPLCLLDKSDKNTSEVEYRSWVKEMLDRIF